MHHGPLQILQHIFSISKWQNLYIVHYSMVKKLFCETAAQNGQTEQLRIVADPTPPLQ